MNSPPGSGADSTVTGLYTGADLAPGYLLAERYRIESLLGVGGMGVVYRATDTALEIPVAVKLLRPELAQRTEAFERFRQELLLARQVSSPHVVRIHDIARDGTRWFITMDLIEGEALDRVLDRRGALPVDEALAIARQLALGLGTAHARGVVHRDLKPSNVLLDREGRACIADFGVARSLGTSGLTHSGTVVGTPDYLSPEQARGGPVDARSDLFALGLLLYEMLTGKLPFDAATPSEAITQRLAGSAAPVRRARADAPAWVERLVAHLLRPNPAHRFQNADAVVAAIDQRRAPRDWRAWRRATAALLLLAALGAAGAYWWPQLAPAPPAEPPPQRVLVLAQGAADAPDTLLAEAWAERLRLAIDAAPAVAAVDAERARQATLQLNLQAGDAPRLDALAQELPGARLLRLVHVSQPGGGQLQAWLREPGEPEREIALSAEDADGDLVQLVRALQPEQAAPSPGLPKAPPAAAMIRYAEAWRLRLAGRLGEAVDAFVATSELAPQYAANWLALAETATLAGLPEQAEHATTRGAAIGAPALAARFAAQRAFLDGDLEAASAPLRQRLGESPSDLAAQLRLAYVLGELGELPAALETLAEVCRRDPGEPRAWFLRGKYSILRGDVRVAVDEYLVRALVLFKRGRNTHGEAETVNALGVGYSRLGQVDDAEEQYRKALDLRRAVGNRRGIASSLRNLAQVDTVRGRHAEADAALVEARGLFETLGDATGLAAIDNERGLLAEERGDYAAALASYRNALRGREALGDGLGAAESLNNIGFAHYQLGDYDSAQVFWRQAEEAFVKLDDQNGITRTRQNLGLLETARGNWARARTLLQQSLEMAQRQQLAEEEAVSRRNLAELDSLQGRYTDALAHLSRAEALFGERDDLRGRVDAALLRSRLYLDAGDPDAALAALDAVTTALEQASSEQRAIAALLRHDLARRAGDATTAANALDAARTVVNAGSTRLLRLQWQLRHAPDAAELPNEVEALGHRPLWLRVQRVALERELAAGDLAAAASRYRELRSALGTLGDYAEAWRLHRLGAQALGEGADAEKARADAAQALATLRAAAPEPLRAKIDAEASP